MSARTTLEVSAGVPLRVAPVFVGYDARQAFRVEAEAPRVLIAGGPKVGKTWLAGAIVEASAGVSPLAPKHVRHTDDLLRTHEWSEGSAEVARWLEAPGPWIIEGVSVVRALRKWLAAHPDPAELPCDVLLMSVTPRIELLPGQRSMLRGMVTVWNEIRDQLATRGLEPIEF